MPQEFQKAWDSIALTPPMGWNSFNTFGCAPNEILIKEVADAMVETGLKDAGYEYVSIDDGWMSAERNAEGRLIPKPEAFPNGLKSLTDYVHAKGLKIGIYLGCGLKTYDEKPGSLGYEEQDAKDIADWGFDLLKYDCRTLDGDPPNRNIREDIITMGTCLRNTGRSMLYSICEHGRTKPWTWAKDTGHMWRLSTDIKDCLDGEFKGGWGFNKIIDENNKLASYAGPGHWNDPDMLIVGLHGINEWMGPGCTDVEYRAHFSLWCLMASPLIIGCDVRKMSDYTKNTLLNRALIDVNQDPLGIQGTRVKSDSQGEVWVKPLSKQAFAVVLYNRGERPADISVDWTDAGLPEWTKASVQDLWEHRDAGEYVQRFSVSVRPHECKVFKLSPIQG